MPATLPVHVTNCGGPFASANGHHDLLIHWADLVRAAIMTGYPDVAAAVMPLTFQRTWAVIFRASIVLGFLDEDVAGRITPSEPYDRADGTEKGTVSYYLGMFAAKVAAERLFNVAFLRHYDTYFLGVFGRPPIGSRPDVIGVSLNGDWLVVEAKGRKWGFTANLLGRSKQQAALIGSIVTPTGNDPVAGNVGSVAWFDHRQWALRMDDPKTTSAPTHLESDVPALLGQYYDPVINYVLAGLEAGRAETVILGGAEFKTVYEPGLDVTIGVSAEIFEAYQASPARLGERLRALLRRVGPAATGPTEPPQLEGVDDGPPWSLGPDGVAIQLGQHWARRI